MSQALTITCFKYLHKNSVSPRLSEAYNQPYPSSLTVSKNNRIQYCDELITKTFTAFRYSRYRNSVCSVILIRYEMKSEIIFPLRTKTFFNFFFFKSPLFLHFHSKNSVTSR